jgi:hypothetical protein
MLDARARAFSPPFPPPLPHTGRRLQAEAADTWRSVHERRYARPPPVATMPELAKQRRRRTSSRKAVGFEADPAAVGERAAARAAAAMAASAEGAMLRAASMRFASAVVDDEEEYAKKFGKYKKGAAPAAGAEASVRAGRVFSSDQSVRAGTANRAPVADPSIRLRGSALDKSVHMKSSALHAEEELAPVRVAPRRGGKEGPASRPVEVPSAGGRPEGQGAADSASDAELRTLASIGE